ncbi:MAG: aminotransferase class I/II-fold pyridoxal phosphate-dependent enzyme [Gammaproteobacteria bacterium]
MIHGHGGNVYEAARRLGCHPSNILDASSNLNPLGPVPGLLSYLAERIAEATVLPEPDARSAVRYMARWAGLAPQALAMGNGSTQFIYAIPQTLGIRNALVVAPTYADYHDACRLAGATVTHCYSDEAQEFVPDLDKVGRKARSVDAVFFCNPNNPTGVYTSSEALADLIRSCPGTLFVIDESYLAFRGAEDTLSLAPRQLPNALVLISLSKMYALAGLRVGFIHGPAVLMEKIRLGCPPWSVNALAAMAVEYLAENPHTALSHAEQSRAYCAHERQVWAKSFANHHGVCLYPGTATFLLGRLTTGQAASLCEYLLDRRILVRDCANFPGLSPAWFRVSIKGAEANARLRRELSLWLTQQAAPQKLF